MKKRIAKKVLKNQENLHYNKGQVRRANTAARKVENRAAKAAQAKTEGEAEAHSVAGATSAE